MQISLSLADSFQANGSAQAKIINHHLMKRVSESVVKAQSHTKEVDRIQSEDTFILSRYLGFPELNSKQHHENT